MARSSTSPRSRRSLPFRARKSSSRSSSSSSSRPRSVSPRSSTPPAATSPSWSTWPPSRASLAHRLLPLLRFPKPPRPPLKPKRLSQKPPQPKPPLLKRLPKLLLKPRQRKLPPLSLRPLRLTRRSRSRANPSFVAVLLGCAVWRNGNPRKLRQPEAKASGNVISNTTLVLHGENHGGFAAVGRSDR